MSGLERDPLDALRSRVEEDYRRAEDDYRRAEEEYRQAEENYRLDLAAIEHLQSRFFGAMSSTPASNYSPPGNGSTSESPAATLPPQFTPAGAQSDDLAGSIRSMFSASRR